MSKTDDEKKNLIESDITTYSETGSTIGPNRRNVSTFQAVNRCCFQFFGDHGKTIIGVIAAIILTIGILSVFFYWLPLLIGYVYHSITNDCKWDGFVPSDCFGVGLGLFMIGLCALAFLIGLIVIIAAIVSHCKEYYQNIKESMEEDD